MGAGYQGMRLAGACILLCACARAEPQLSDEVSGANLRRCPGLTVHTQQDLDDARDCEIIDGDLTFRPATLERVNADALPRLRKVTGSVLSGGATTLTEITLPALREVGASPDDTLSIGFDAHTLERVELPMLESVDGSLGIAALGGLRELDLGSLAKVSGNFGLLNLPRLVDVRIGVNVSAGGRVDFQLLCHVSSAALPDASNFDPSTWSVRDVGCCTDGAAACSTTCQCQ